jgi:hypothetical protein
MTHAVLARDLLEGRAARSPLKVRVMHAVSSAVVLLLLAVATLTVIASARVAGATQSSDPAAVGPGSDRPVVLDGPAVSALVDGLAGAAVTVGGDIVEIRLDNPRALHGGLTFRVDVPGSGASTIARLLARLERIGIDQPRVTSVMAVPGGSRIDVIGAYVPSMRARSRTTAQQDHADVSVRIADLTQEAGVDLRRLETGDADRNGTVRVIGTGTRDGIVRLISELERDLSAPSRIRSLRVRPTSDRGSYEVDLQFVIREMDPRREAAPLASGSSAAAMNAAVTAQEGST